MVELMKEMHLPDVKKAADVYCGYYLQNVVIFDVSRSKVEQMDNFALVFFDNYALDHIRPIAEFKRCDVAADWALAHHFTNLQPLLPSDNAFKSDKWDSECEDYWRTHIIRKPDYHQNFKSQYSQ